jgi:benzoate membrane transport protein
MELRKEARMAAADPRTKTESAAGAPSKPTDNAHSPAARLDRDALTKGLTGFLFAATGALAILITVGRAGGLSEEAIASWIFAAYGLSGVISLFLCWHYRQPLAMGWTMPGALLLPSALSHLSFTEVIGAYWVTGLLITVLGWSGLVDRVMWRIPLPIVMGMVAGVFLPLVLKIITAFTEHALLAAVTLAAFLLFTVVPALGQRLPPVLVALLVGGVTAWTTGSIAPLPQESAFFARPVLYLPEFSLRAQVELVIPLAITVLGIQNAQGFAILQQAGHPPPVKAVTIGSGLGALVFAVFGSVPACLTGPVNGILVASGERRTHWIGGMLFAVAMIAFGLFAPAATRLALALPVALIALIGGLAMLRVLQGAFQAAFSGECSLGALVAFVVTTAGVPIFTIGAPFWGLVFAFATSWLLERDSLRRATTP